MEDKASCFFLARALSPVHAGAGEGDGMKGSPIQRAADGAPIIDSAGWKGAVKSLLKRDDEKNGKIIFSDLKLLFFPVRASRGIYALITSCKVLQEAAELLHIYKPAGYEKLKDAFHLLAKGKFGRAYGFTGGLIQIGDVTYLADELGDKEKNYFLESFPALRGHAEHIFIIPDKDFENFLKLETESNMRIEVDSKKRASAKRKLFAEEYLPEESVLYGFISIFQDIKNIQEDLQAQLQQYLNDMPDQIQIGSGWTLGKGKVQLYRGGE